MVHRHVPECLRPYGTPGALIVRRGASDDGGGIQA